MSKLAELMIIQCVTSLRQELTVMITNQNRHDNKIFCCQYPVFNSLITIIIEAMFASLKSFFFTKMYTSCLKYRLSVLRHPP